MRSQDLQGISAVSLKDKCAFSRAPFYTLAVLTALSLAIALGNCSSAPVTMREFERFAESNEVVERAFGWPLSWYWRRAIRVPETQKFVRVQWALSRYSATCLFCNLAAWLAMLAIACAGCQWVFRRYHPRRYRRPRIPTLIVCTAACALVALSNLSNEGGASSGKASFGWPLAWYWCLMVANWVPPHVYGWDYSARGLALNLFVWLLLLFTTRFIAEWAYRRFRQRLQWSLRTMLIVVGLVAAFYAWCAGLWRRAGEQDALVAWVNGDGRMYFERWGPQWLDLVGADRFRRRLVGANLGIQAGDVEDERHFERLARLPGLRYLDVIFYDFPPAVAAMLGRTRELQMLRFGYEDEDGDGAGNAAHAYFAAVGELIQLRQLHLKGGLQLRGDDIGCLRGLANLKSLTLDLGSAHDSESTRECLLAVGQLNQLERLYLGGRSVRRADLACLGGLTNLRSLTLWPVENTYFDSNTSDGNGDSEVVASLRSLRQLEGLDLTGVRVTFQVVRALADLARLKFLCLGHTQVNAAGLAQLAAIKSLEELGLDEVTAMTNLRALNALTRLKAVHISRRSVAGARLALDHGDYLLVSPSEVEHLRNELEAIRQWNPGILIRADYDDFQRRRFEGTGALDPPWDHDEAMDSAHASYLWDLLGALHGSASISDGQNAETGQNDL